MSDPQLNPEDLNKPDGDDLLQTVKFRNVIPIPPKGAAKALGGAGAGSKAKQQQDADRLRAAFADLENEETDLGSTMRFRGVFKVPDKSDDPAKAETSDLKNQRPPKTGSVKKSGPKPRKAPSPDAVAMQDDTLEEVEDENLTQLIVLVAVFSMLAGIVITTAALYLL